MVKVIEQMTVRVERWKIGSRKPEIDSITVRRVRSNTEPPQKTIEKMMEEVLKSFKPFNNNGEEKE